MLFNSLKFLLFFPIVTIIYFALPHKFRWVHLLIASCIFYMAFVPVYILILFTTIIIDYIAGILIEKSEGSKRKLWLIASIAANVGILGFFKYYNFFSFNVNALFSSTHINANIPILKLILPIGLSFHTFQAMSYTIEVYLDNQKAERHLGIYALYVMFYPQLVAGPIERPQNLLHQFHERHKFEYGNVASGLRLMLWGMFKKVVIADRLALFCDPVFNDPKGYSGIVLALAAFIFVFQIYCDFSGYTDIAIGAARVMGFKLATNFNRPFSSRSISEFWRKWHISLSSWFFDYVYNPLVFSLRSWGMKFSIIFSFFVTFFLSGFWHGAGWNFIIWGVMQGAVPLTFEFLTKSKRQKIFGRLPKWLNDNLSMCFTFSYLVIINVLFRVNHLRDALVIYDKFLSIPRELMLLCTRRNTMFLNLPDGITTILPCFGLILFLEIFQLIQVRVQKIKSFDQIGVFYRWGLYYCGIAAIYFFGVYDNHQFIYFQF